MTPLIKSVYVCWSRRDVLSL